MIVRFGHPGDAAHWCAAEGAAGRTLGFVPTMGALHEGHVALVRRALAENDRACVSVFVNPLQFDDPADFAAYPRDFEADVVRLDAAGCSMVFTGTPEAFFPERPAPVDPGPCAEGLEGEHRNGHFAGVATVVARLFDLVQPTRAYFGQKDFQQALVVRDLARRRGGPQIVVHPTVREPSGLALSSRNARLDAEGRQRALGLHRALRAARAAWLAGERRARSLQRVLCGALEREALSIDYAEVRDPERWSARAPEGELDRAVALVAARVGAVRLIDNLVLSAPEGEAG